MSPAYNTPSDYGLPHPSWRPYQYASVNWCQRLDGVGLMEAPTGSGKTGVAKAVSAKQSVIALCRTKNLQDENYGQEYGAAVLFGRANYKCVHPDAEYGTTCAECHYNKMAECPSYHRCQYVEAKEEARAAQFTTLNYAYYLTAHWPRYDRCGTLFLDEAHQLPGITLDFAGCTITAAQQLDWGMQAFPEIASGNGILIQRSHPTGDALSWLEKSNAQLKLTYKRLKDAGRKKKMAKCENLRRKITATISALENCPDDWYIRSGDRAQKYRGDYRPAFIAKPLTARHHFSRYFYNDSLVAMSATIGNPDTFAAELGIQESQVRVVPSQWAPKQKQVHILDCPKMGRSAILADFKTQANAIAEAILKLPSDWSGLILVTRKKEAQLLANRLADRSLGNRVWVTPGWDGAYTPTDEQVKAWNIRKKRVPGSICVTWALWEGFNGLDEKICIVAKTPYPFLGSEYERERLNYSGSFYLQRTAWQLEQGLGRTRRGRPEDYGDDNGFVAIADKSWSRVKKYLSASMRESIVTL